MVGVLPLLATRRPRTGRSSEPARDARQALRAASSTGTTPAALAAGRGQGWSRVRPATGVCCSGSSRPATAAASCARVFDEDEFLSPYGLRGAVAATTRSTRVSSTWAGTAVSVDYEPAESTHRDVRRQLQLARAGVVAGELPRRCAACSATPATSATSSTIEYPTGSGQHGRPSASAPTTSGTRLISLFLARPGRAPALPRLGRQAPGRPALAGQHRCSTSTSTATTAPGSAPRHQTGWTGLVADLICRAGPVRRRLAEPWAAVTPGLPDRVRSRASAARLEEAAPREWLVTDGLGGYACGTVAGLRTRRYHGLLVAATAPAGASRMLGLAALDAVVVIGDRRDPAGHPRVGRRCDRPARARAPRRASTSTTASRAGATTSARSQLEVEVAMAHGVSACRCRPPAPGRCGARLEVTPLCTWRDQHGERFAGADPRSSRPPYGFVFESRLPGGRARTTSPAASGTAASDHREEAARGLGAAEDLWAAGTFAGRPARRRGARGDGHHRRSTAPSRAPRDWSSPPRAGAGRRSGGPGGRPRTTSTGSWPWPRTGSWSRPRAGPTAVAGYPWFGEWSRDLFTSYEGLFLCTGRAERAARCCAERRRRVSEGMLANTADVGTLEYNTIDATLWFLHALGRHVARHRRPRPRRRAAATVDEIVTAHRPAPGSASASTRHRAAARRCRADGR